MTLLSAIGYRPGAGELIAGAFVIVSACRGSRSRQDVSRVGQRAGRLGERLGVDASRLWYCVDAPAEGDKRSRPLHRDEVTKALDGSRRRPARRLVFVTLIGHGTAPGHGEVQNAPDRHGPGGVRALWRKIKPPRLRQSTSAAAVVEALSGSAVHRAATRNGASRRHALWRPLRGALSSEPPTPTRTSASACWRRFSRQGRGGQAYKREGCWHRARHPADTVTGRQPDPSPTARRQGRHHRLVGTWEGRPATDPKIRALYLERRELERRVEAHRLLKESIPPARYTDELEKLVTALALKTREIRAAEGK